jgi:hypothetical protein
MENRIEELETEISSLKMKLQQVEGTTTEVYSRIVGYYRSVKNWNLGKKEEYKKRVAFTKMDGKQAETLIQEVCPVTEKLMGDSKGILSYSFFYRSSCPHCPAMKEAWKRHRKNWFFQLPQSFSDLPMVMKSSEPVIPRRLYPFLTWNP